MTALALLFCCVIAEAERLRGTCGTRKLKGYPMDGGIVIDNNIHAVRKREGHISYAQPHQKEAQTSTGRNCRINRTTKQVVSWKDRPHLKARFLNSAINITIGEGSYIETVELADKKPLCVWGSDGKI